MPLLTWLHRDHANSFQPYWCWDRHACNWTVSTCISGPGGSLLPQDSTPLPFPSPSSHSSDPLTESRRNSRIQSRIADSLHRRAWAEHAQIATGCLVGPCPPQGSGLQAEQHVPLKCHPVSLGYNSQLSLKLVYTHLSATSAFRCATPVSQ